MDANHASNCVLLDAIIAERSALRFTPAGVAAIDFVLRHRSRQHEAGAERAVECELAAVAFEDCARAIAITPAGAVVRCEGFLARRWRTGITMALHVNAFELIRTHLNER